VTRTAAGPKIADYEFGTQVFNQVKGARVTLVWSGGGSFILYKVVNIPGRLRRPRLRATDKASPSPFLEDGITVTLVL
jgi:hypothetical protein